MRNARYDPELGEYLTEADVLGDDERLEDVARAKSAPRPKAIIVRDPWAEPEQ